MVLLVDRPPPSEQQKGNRRRSQNWYEAELGCGSVSLAPEPMLIAIKLSICVTEMSHAGVLGPKD